MTRNGAFWERHETRARDAGYAREYAGELARVRAIDSVVNALDEHRIAAGLSKAALARAIGSDPSVVRRLLTASTSNPTLSTVAEVAAVLGLKVSLIPMDDDERTEVTEPMLSAACPAGELGVA